MTLFEFRQWIESQLPWWLPFAFVGVSALIVVAKIVWEWIEGTTN